MWFLIFFISAFFTLYAGNKLAKHGDIIGEKTQLGGLWVGSFILAFVTSLPELSTAIFSQTIKAPDLVFGDIFGSNMFNLTILGFVDIMLLKSSVFSQAHDDHSKTVAVVFLSTLLIILSFYLPYLQYKIFGFSISTILIILIYVLFQMSLFKNSNEQEYTEEMKYEAHTLKRSVFAFIIYSVIIIISALFLSLSSKQISIILGLNQTFVGSLFIGIVTSLPELTVTISALKLNALDMAIGDLFGSNLFNVVALAISQPFFKGNMFNTIHSNENAMTAIFSIVIMSLILIGIGNKGEKRIFKINSLGLLIVISYALGILYIGI